MKGSGLTSSIYHRADHRDGDAASVKRLARTAWRERGVVTLSPEELEQLPPVTRREVIALMEARHGKRNGK